MAAPALPVMIFHLLCTNQRQTYSSISALPRDSATASAMYRPSASRPLPAAMVRMASASIRLAPKAAVMATIKPPMTRPLSTPTPSPPSLTGDKEMRLRSTHSNHSSGSTIIQTLDAVQTACPTEPTVSGISSAMVTPMLGAGTTSSSARAARRRGEVFMRISMYHDAHTLRHGCNTVDNCNCNS